MSEETDARSQAVAEGIANIVGAPYTDWRHFTGEAQAILSRLDSHPTPAADEVEAVARALATAEGLNYDEVCGYETEAEECDSGTCIAAHFEDHDADHARGIYDRLARAAIAALQARSEATNSAEGRASTFAACPQEKPNREAASRPSAEPAGEEPVAERLEALAKERLEKCLNPLSDGGKNYDVGYATGLRRAAEMVRSTPSNPDRSVEAISLAEIKEIAAAATLSACESDPADPEHPDTINISTEDFEAIVHCAVENWAERKAAAQDQGES